MFNETTNPTVFSFKTYQKPRVWQNLGVFILCFQLLYSVYIQMNISIRGFSDPELQGELP